MSYIFVNNTCKRCGVAKTSNNCYRDTRTKSGFETNCKSCKAEMKLKTFNPVAAKAYQVEYISRVENKQRHKVVCSAYAKANRDKFRLANSNYYKRNPAKSAAKVANRKAIKLSATPKWANTKDIEVIYEKCKRLTKWLGVKHHVDHIVPLNSKLVCGLHVDDNLQIIPAIDNIIKGNRIWPNDWRV